MSMLLRFVLAVVFVAGSLFAQLTAAQSEQPRTALVIGNAAYDYAPLANPVNDAVAIARSLTSAGFDVILQTDADRAAMDAAVEAFAGKLRDNGGVGLLYYAGHGIQIDGENYLLPVGDAPAEVEALKDSAVAVSDAVEAMTSAHEGLNIVVLDACRNNPLTGSTKGLTRIDSSARLFVSYSTSPGGVALDGEGDNSPYTKHLAEAIETPALSLEQTFKRTLKGVFQETDGQQTPWISSSFFGDFTFVPAPGDDTAPAQVAAVSSIGKALQESIARAGPAHRISGIYRVQGTNPNGTVYDGMMAITPDDSPDNSKVRFTWWIGKDVFTGVGEFAGRMLVVNWGDKHPVVYTFSGGENLDGEWADGSATERLSLYARAAPGPQDLLEGTYAVSGRNPNGTTYTGTVTLSRQGSRYTLIWKVGATGYRGVGELEGNVLTVDWGDKTPVVYALTAEGGLKGLWAAGRGAEELTRLEGQ
ncbi:caspase family protein [Roseibium sediminicola]|uniref:Caspase family protein n=1 Tax=Roseibium sediminicola TaxID=2933272 RepID=A0ABT0GVD2_9HYPH|nr:caspase family protein [Roseibium sp. CAU 1639]MCK7613396.1 caspase family protein [Roseibium sp. CAU 1639]